jgi:transposase
MDESIVTLSTTKNKRPAQYDHYIAVDWSQKNMAIARSTQKSKHAHTLDLPSSLSDLKDYLFNLKGSKIITIEECPAAQWLYVELADYVDKVLICDPYRNRLLFDGAKNDVLDAEKLCLLLRNGLLKEVYHTHNSLFELRKYVSAYEDIIRAGVRIKNQRSSLFRSEGKNFRKGSVENDVNSFIVGIIDKNINTYEEDKEQYKSLFEKLKRKNTILKNLCKVPGIEIISAVKILANVIDAHRFPKKGNYLAYCGLVKHKRVSGQKTYGLRNPRYNRVMKSVYKSAALGSIIATSNPMKDYYEYLLEKGVAVHNARNALARHIAVITYGMLKSGEKYQPYKWRKEVKLISN